MTSAFRSLSGIVFAALLALALIVMTTDAMAASRSLAGGGSNILDPGLGSSHIYYHPKPVGRFGVTWE